MYSILIISSVYTSSLLQFEKTNPNFKELDFHSLSELMNNSSTSIADKLSYQFNKLGVESNFIISNYQFLQNKWAKENNINAKSDELLIEQISYYSPVVILTSGFGIDSKLLKAIKQKVPTLKYFITLHASPISKREIEIGKEYDLVISSIMGMVRFFKKNGLNSIYMPHAFDDRILKQIGHVEKENKLVFAGSLTSGNQFHDDRIRMIFQLLKKNLPVDIFANIRNKKSLVNKLMLISYKIYNQFPLILKNTLHKNKILSTLEQLDENFFKDSEELKYIKHYVKPAKFGIDYYKVLASASISFNNHINITGNYTGNIRLFEATGVGSLLITDEKIDNNELFEIDKEILTYASYDEAIEKIQWALNNPNEAKVIAEAGQRRTLKDHTYKNRVEQLNRIIQEKLM